MNPLERHGIHHLSPSSLNLWRASPGLWSARYLAGLKDDNAAYWRGHAVEAGLLRLLLGGSIEEAQSDAFDFFGRNAMDEDSEHIELERSLILPMLDRAAAWKAPAKLAASQLRV